MDKTKEILIDPTKTYTKSEYARAYQVSRPTIDKQISSKDLIAVEIKGTTLILAK